MSSIKKFRLLVFAAALVIGAIPAIADSIVEDIVARINDQIITASELKRSKEQLLTELKQQYGAEADAKYAERDKDILRDLIDQKLLLAKGKADGLTGDTELVKRLDELRKQMNLESMDDLEKEALKQGVSFEDFKQNIRSNIITQQVIGRDVGSKIQMTQQDAQKFFKEHQKELEQPESIQLSEILVSIDKAVPEDPKDPDSKAVTARRKAEKTLAAIRAGKKFEDAARESSDGPTAAQGGDLGVFKPGQLAKELQDRTFAMKAGDISDVIRTKQGFIILKVTAHNAAGMPTMKQIEPQIQEQIYLEKLQPALRAYLTKLREVAYVDVKPGFIDSGASANQTKPVYTNTALEESKKKKKKRMLIF